jgi:D-alanyl-D-alanine carboxypeptidase/D-alanyl-D-alanine-endopeptidase (penicillin-binding protein 4)
MTEADRRPRRRHHERLAGLLAATLAIACALPALGQSLTDTLRSRIERAGLGQVDLGVSVVNLDTGRTVVDLEAETGRTPASNMKLLTSACALLALGPDFAFRTEIQLAGDRLIVLGAGDPALGDPDLLKALDPPMTPDDMLDAIVRSVAGAGVTSLSEVVVDDRIFVYEGPHPAWPEDQLHRWYCAEVSGINFNTNVLDVYARPQRLRGGAPARAELSVTPRMPWLSTDNRVQTINDRDRQSGIDTLRPEPGVNRLLVIGQVSVPAGPAHVSVYDPAIWFGQLLADRLASAGVSVGPDDVPARLAVRRPEEGEDFGEARALVAISTPLDEILLRCNRDSQNLYAEALLKRIAFEVTGQPGSWATGTDVVRMMLIERLGTRLSSSLRISDGSGMSRANQVSPAAIAQWLRLVDADAAIRDDLRRSMASPGSGTLRRRFIAKPPQNTMLAKTGLLSGVRALSGYIESPQGPAVAFSILIDNIPASLDPAARRTIDELALDIDAWVSQQAARQPSLGG